MSGLAVQNFLSGNRCGIAAGRGFRARPAAFRPTSSPARTARPTLGKFLGRLVRITFRISCCPIASSAAIVFDFRRHDPELHATDDHHARRKRQHITGGHQWPARKSSRSSAPTVAGLSTSHQRPRSKPTTSFVDHWLRSFSVVISFSLPRTSADVGSKQAPGYAIVRGYLWRSMAMAAIVVN